MNQPCNTHGAFSWCELMTTDTDAAKQFYGKLFHWTLEPAPISTPEMEYTLVKYGSEPSGGMMKLYRPRPKACRRTGAFMSRSTMSMPPQNLRWNWAESCWCLRRIFRRSDGSACCKIRKAP